MWTKLLLLSLAGAAGTLSRYAIQYPLQVWAVKVTGWSFPFGTLPVNVAGCFLFGLVWAMAETDGMDRAVIGAEARLVVLVGFLGAFTTFSTFGFETGDLLRNDRLVAAGLNLLLQNGVGIVMALAGIRVGTMVSARLLGV